MHIIRWENCGTQKKRTAHLQVEKLGLPNICGPREVQSHSSKGSRNEQLALSTNQPWADMSLKLLVITTYTMYLHTDTASDKTFK